MQNSALIEEKLSKVFVVNVIPSIIAMIINGSQPIIDGLFLGKFIGPNAMASVNIAQPFMQLIYAIAFVICTGAVSQIGRSMGANCIEKAQSVFRTACVTSTMFSVLILIFGSIFSDGIARLLGASELLLEGSSLYIFVLSFFAPIICNMYLFGYSDRIIDKPNQYLYGAIASLIANVILDYLFIAHFNLGILGAGLATGFSYLVSFSVNIIPVLKKKNAINLFVGKLRFKLMLPVSANGASEAVVCGSTAITVFMFNITLQKLAGEAGVASFTIINYISTFGALAMFGISDGINAIVSYNYGSNKMDRVKKTYAISLLCNIVIGLTVFFVVYFAGDKLIAMFSKDAEAEKNIIAMAYHGAQIYSFAFLLIGFNIVSSGFFTAIGGALSSISIALSRGLIFVLIGITTFPIFMGIDGVWLTMPFAEACTVVVTICCFVAHYFLKKRKNTQKNLQEVIDK